MTDSEIGAEEQPEETRAGFIAILGRPNAGKSTLLNRIVETRLSIVTPRPQTTWRRVSGIRTHGSTQMIFLDTPGVMEPRDRLHRSLLLEAERSAREADVVLLMADPVERATPGERAELARILGEVGGRVLTAVNKVDAARADAVREETAWLEELTGGRAFVLSAGGGEGVEELLAAIEAALPSGPWLYPEDEISTESVRFFVTEMVREAMYELYREELPYAAFCEVEEFRESEDPVYIQVNVFVEKASQKGIVIGKGGAAIRALGTRARERIEHFLGRRVYLDLWIKVLPGWRRNEVHLRRLGLPLPEPHAD